MQTLEVMEIRHCIQGRNPIFFQVPNFYQFGIKAVWSYGGYQILKLIPEFEGEAYWWVVNTEHHFEAIGILVGKAM